LAFHKKYRIKKRINMKLDEKIATLTDQQALSIVDSLAGEFAGDDLPQGRNEQAEALTSMLEAESHPADSNALLQADATATAEAARALLKTMAEVPEMRESVDYWLDHPPVQETAAIPLLLAVPVVLTGCIALLTVVGNTHIHRDENGKWLIDYDPTGNTPMNKNLVKILKILSGSTHGKGIA
jgi:hypothetical protein